MILQDVRYALRGFLRSPAHTAVALLSLALGIGATTAIFSVVYGVLIDPYPYAKSKEIWMPAIRDLKSRQGRGSYSVAEYQQLQKVDAFSDVMATGMGGMRLIGGREPESVASVLLSGSAFHFLGVPPILGRTIAPSDIRPSGEPERVVVLSYLTWKRLFDGDPNAIGKTLRLSDEPHTVIGVMPPRFGWFGDDGVWMPLGTDQRETLVNPLVRLRPGVSSKAAEQQLHALNQEFARLKPETFPKDGFRTTLINYMDVTVASGEMRTSLRILFGAVAFLLLIACANVANLQLARATARAREIAVRMSIGAERGHVLRQLLTESLLLSVLGGAVGILFAIATTKAIVALMPSFYVPNEARITVNWQVLGFSTAVSVLTGILFGLAPALQCSRPNLTEALRDAGRGSGASAESSRTRSLLVVAEVALAAILLMGASLTVQSFIAIQHVDPGFQADRVLMIGFALVPQRYSTLEQRNAFAQSLLERVEALPGVQTAAVGNGGMLFGSPGSTFSIEGRPSPEVQRLQVGLISGDYLRTLGIPVLRGRALSEQEVQHADGVALINQAAAKLWPAGVDPIGQRMRVDLLSKPPRPPLLGVAKPSITVVGIIRDVKNNGLREDPSPAVFVPYTLLAPPQRALALRTEGDPMLVLNGVREKVRELDKNQPLGRPLTMTEIIGFETSQPRFNTALFSFFATLGLTLAMAGIYSVLSYHVTRRTHEIGVRMALGAQHGDVMRLMLTMGGKLVLTGLAIGIAGSLFLTRFLRSQLFQVEPTDPLSIALVAAVLGAIALLACYVPARRAARLAPMIALRYE